MELKTLDSALVLHRKRCHSWLCPVCRQKRGFEVRDFLRSNLDFFRIPKLFTLTIDPKGFDSALSAFQFVRKNFYIPRLMRYLGVRRWFAVLEFQRNSFPHWHILLDVSELPSGVVNGRFVPHLLDFARIQHLWRYKWSIGCQVRLSEKHTDSALHAVNYITKYLIKEPSNGYPDWIWSSNGIRFFSASKGLSLSGQSSNSTNKDEDDDDENEDGDDIEDSKHKHKVPVVIRVCRCGTESFITSDSRFICELPLPVEFFEDFDLYSLSQSDSANGVYSVPVLDKDKADTFLSCLMDDSNTSDIDLYVENLALQKASKLKITEVYLKNVVPF